MTNARPEIHWTCHCKTVLFLPGDQGSVENEYAYIDRAKLATFAHSEYSMAR